MVEGRQRVTKSFVALFENAFLVDEKSFVCLSVFGRLLSF
jgi:hypothetical protein